MPGWWRCACLSLLVQSGVWPLLTAPHPSPLPEGEGIVLYAPGSGALLSECIDQGIEQRARNLNDLGRGVVVLLEFDQVGGFFVEVDRGQRVAVVGRLFEDGAGRVAVLPGLGCQGADPLDQIAITVGETDPGADAH